MYVTHTHTSECKLDTYITSVTSQQQTILSKLNLIQVIIAIISSFDIKVLIAAASIH